MLLAQLRFHCVLYWCFQFFESNFNFEHLIKLSLSWHARGRSLEESMIFHNYNRFRISDSSKDFWESHGVSAWFSKILKINSESLKAAVISKIQKNHRESFRIFNYLMRSLACRLDIRGAVKLYWFSADIAGDRPFMKQSLSHMGDHQSVPFYSWRDHHPAINITICRNFKVPKLPPPLSLSPSLSLFWLHVTMYKEWWLEEKRNVPINEVARSR